MPSCQTNLVNIGSGDCPLVMNEIKRIIFTSYKDSNNALNYITQASAAAIANWQARFDVISWETNPLSKFVPTPILYDVKSEQADADVYSEAGFSKKLRDGSYQLTFMLNDVNPDVIRAFKDMENQSLAVFLVDADTRVWGKDPDIGTAASVGTNLYPIRVQNMSVPDFAIQSRENPSQVMITIWIETPSDMNKLASVAIADGDVTDDSNFYSLIDGTVVASSPATTGCVFTATTDRYGEGITGIVYSEIAFVNTVSAVSVSPADASKLTYAAPNYTVNEVALLTSGQSYYVQISTSGYDLDRTTITVP